MLTIQTREVLCFRYGICDKTLRKVLRNIGIKHRGHLTPLDLELLVTKYGSPELLKQMAERLKS
jgi:hypothetical protein